MEFKVGDILVCKPGYNSDHGNYRDETSGGSGWEDGRIAKVVSTSFSVSGIYWGFARGAGVFEQALRKATPEEVKLFKKGVFNIHDFKEYTISYTSTDGKIKKKKIKASSKENAVSKIKDVKNINYIIG